MKQSPEYIGQQIQADVMKALSQASQADGPSTQIIAIDGPGGGAGKSTLAMYLSQWLGGVPIIHTDDFASYDNILNWEDDFIQIVINPLMNGKQACYQKYNWESRSKYGKVIIPHGQTVIFEGNGAMRLCFDQYLSCKIWVDSPSDVRLKRALDRDGQDERTKKKWRRWMKQWDNYVASEKPQLRADLIVDGTMPYATNFRGSDD